MAGFQGQAVLAPHPSLECPLPPLSQCPSTQLSAHCGKLSCEHEFCCLWPLLFPCYVNSYM